MQENNDSKKVLNTEKHVRVWPTFCFDCSYLQPQMTLKDSSGFLEIPQSVFVCFILRHKYYQREKKQVQGDVTKSYSHKLTSAIYTIHFQINLHSFLLACSSWSFSIFWTMSFFCISFCWISDIVSEMACCFSFSDAFFCPKSGRQTLNQSEKYSKRSVWPTCNCVA